jgi:hypothetical protein
MTAFFGGAFQLLLSIAIILRLLDVGEIGFVKLLRNGQGCPVGYFRLPQRVTLRILTTGLPQDNRVAR